MRKKKNGKIIILLSTLVLVCLISFFYVINNYEKVKELFPKDNKNVVNDKVDKEENIVADINENQEEISLGDCHGINNCSSCNTGYLYSRTSTIERIGVYDKEPSSCYATAPSATYRSADTIYTNCTKKETNAVGADGNTLYIWSGRKWTKKETYSCRTCNGGYYLNNGSCTTCPAGSYCSGTSAVGKCPKGKSSLPKSSSISDCESCSAGYYNGTEGGTCTSCRDGYISESQGATTCTKCKDGYWSNRTHTECLEIQISRIDVSAGDKFFVPKESSPYGHSFTAHSDLLGVLPVTWKIVGRGSYSSVDIARANDDYCNVKVSGKQGNADYSCDNYKIQATYSPKEAKAKTKVATAEVCTFKCNWSSKNVNNRYYSKALSPLLSSKFTNSSCTFYQGSPTTYEGKSVWRLDSIWNRCCEDPPIPPTTIGHCYGTKEFLGMKDNDVKWLLKENGEYKYKYDNIENSDDCKIIKTPSTCTSENINIKKENKSTTTCEQNDISFDLTDGMKCNQFYEIKCNTNVSVGFDYGDDKSTKTSNLLLAGQGFKFAVNTTTSKTCSFEFFAKKWKTAYNLAVKRFNTVTNDTIKNLLKQKTIDVDKIYKELKCYSNKNDKTQIQNCKEDASKVFELANDVLALEKIVTDYNNYEPESANEGDGTLDFSYRLTSKKDIITDNYKLVKLMDPKKNGEGKSFIDETYNLNATSPITGKKITNPVKKVWSNNINAGKKVYENPKVIKYVPDIVYFDGNTGNVTTSKDNAVYGGYRVYTDPNISSDFSGIKNPIEVKLTNIGSIGSSVTDNKCTIKIQKSSILYRTFDVKNPFINSDRKITENWLNNTYNFTKTIKDNIWSQGSLYTVPLSSDDIIDLKKSNKGSNNTNLDANVYLGNCHKSPKMQDAITRKICSMITK